MTAPVDAERVRPTLTDSSIEKPAAPAELAPAPQGVQSTDAHLSSPRRRPWLLEARSSVLLIAFMAAWGLLADLAVYGIVVPVVPFRLRQLGYAEDQIASLTSWLIAAYAGGLIVSSPPIGILGEVIENRKWPLVGAIGLMLGSIILFMLGPSYASLVVARILQGFSGTAVWTLSLALIGDTVDPDRVGEIMGYVMIGFSIGAFIGPPVGGALYAQHGFLAPFYFAIAIVVVDLVLRLSIVELDVAKSFGHQPRWAATGQTGAIGGKGKGRRSWNALKRLSRNPRIWVNTAVGVMNGVVVGGLYDSGLTLYTNERFSFDSLRAGLLFLSFVGPGFVIQPLAGRWADRYGAWAVGLAGLACVVPTVALLAILAPLPAFVVLLVLQGAASSVILPALALDLHQTVESTPGLGFAHAYSIFNLAFSIGALIGPICAGQLLGHLGFQVTAGVSAGLALVCVPLWVLYIPRRAEADRLIALAKESTLDSREGIVDGEEKLASKRNSSTDLTIPPA